MLGHVGDGMCAWLHCCRSASVTASTYPPDCLPALVVGARRCDATRNRDVFGQSPVRLPRKHGHLHFADSPQFLTLSDGTSPHDQQLVQFTPGVFDSPHRKEDIERFPFPLAPRPLSVVQTEAARRAWPFISNGGLASQPTGFRPHRALSLNPSVPKISEKEALSGLERAIRQLP